MNTLMKLIATVLLVMVTGCGQTLYSVASQDGVPRRKVIGEVGYSTVSIEDHKNDAEMPVCVARIGTVKGQLLDPVVQCEEDVVKNHRRIQRQRDIAADPWTNYYGPMPGRK